VRKCYYGKIRAETAAQEFDIASPLQLALRTSVSSTSVTVTGAGCSVISTAAVSTTVSTTGATGGFTFRAAFFTGADLGLALATVRFAAFAALDTLRALPRLAEFAFRSLARCTFDSFLRLAMMKLP
jgi:hypothetical protein